MNASSVSTFGSTEVALFPDGKRRGETVSSLFIPWEKGSNWWHPCQESSPRIPIKVQCPEIDQGSRIRNKSFRLAHGLL